MKIALVQMTSVLDYKQNLEKLDLWFALGKKENVVDYFLPESFYSFSNGVEVTPHFMESGNTHEQKLLTLVKKHGVNLWGGSCIYKVNNQYYNRALFINSQGKIVSHYDKMHLFYFNNTTPGQVSHDEASKYLPGKSLSLLKMNADWKLGATICYDVRFPEMYRNYSLAGANVMSVSSAFTIPTGQAHWHTLLRARAIENLSYIVASAQWGKHNERISTFGHSLIISPWGEIEVDMKDGEGVVFHQLDLEKVKTARIKLSNLWSNFLK